MLIDGILLKMGAYELIRINMKLLCHAQLYIFSLVDGNRYNTNNLCSFNISWPKEFNNNELNFLFVTLYVVLLFAGAIAKSAQFPLHVWLPDTMDGPIPISTLIHAATMVASGIFLVARLLPLFGVIPYIMYLISVIGTITVLLGDILALAQKDIKRGLTYFTMSQLGYMMLALGMGS